jgi:hypothetical protein
MIREQQTCAALFAVAATLVCIFLAVGVSSAQIRPRPYECPGKLVLKRGSKSNIIFTLRCSQGFDGFYFEVVPSFFDKNGKSWGSSGITSFWMNFHLFGSGAEDGMGECWRLRADVDTQPGLACSAEINGAVTAQGEFAVKRGERCKRVWLLRQFGPVQPGGPGTPFTPPAVSTYWLYFDKPLGCPNRKS